MSSNSQGFSDFELYEYPLAEDNYWLVANQPFVVNFAFASFFHLSIFIGYSVDKEVNYMDEMSIEFLCISYSTILFHFFIKA